MGNVCLSAGPPSLVLGLGLNLGFGRGSSGSGRNAKYGRSGGGNSGDISNYTTEGRGESASMRGRAQGKAPSKMKQATQNPSKSTNDLDDFTPTRSGFGSTCRRNEHMCTELVSVLMV